MIPEEEVREYARQFILENQWLGKIASMGVNIEVLTKDPEGGRPYAHTQTIKLGRDAVGNFITGELDADSD